MQQLILVLSVIISLAAQASFAKKPECRLKNGRQYIFDLERALGISDYEMRRIYRQVNPNLARHGDLSEFAAAKDSMAKMASLACDFLDWMDPPSDIKATYKTILDRSPNKEEEEMAIAIGGEFNFFPNCMVITMSPEFILTNAKECL